jgi:THO complex subunit 2
MNVSAMFQQEGRRTETILDKKERSSKGKMRDEQKELRREKKQGRKRVIRLYNLL